MAKFDESSQPNFAAALTKKTLQAYELLEVILDPTDVDDKFYLTNAINNITYNGNTYVAVGGILGFSDVEESQLFGITEITVTLAGLPFHDIPDPGDPNTKLNFTSEFLAKHYTDKPLRIYRAYLDNDKLIEDSGTPAVIQLFDGRIDSPAVSDSETGDTVIAVKATSHWVDFERRGGRRTNDNEQRNTLHYNGTDNFNGDRLFEFSYDSIKDIKWKAPS